ncbi:GNAT family N-acetyltransferase [Flavobacteriaceae bacterium]|nr:GNAT family N-acetyltransferase [Flavobacteriaceae bacterium]
MKFFIFNFNSDLHLIDGFLESASQAHKIQKKTRDWFLWKFRDNPYGESILACAEVDGKIIGCVAYGAQTFMIENETVKGAFAFENFVHPDYQGKGLFGDLITLSEKETKIRGIQILLVFPNKNSLRGYKKRGWIQENIIEYWLKPSNPLKIMFNLNNLKKTFEPSKSNLKVLNLYGLSLSEFHLKSKTFQAVVDLSYLKWRFYIYPVSKYIVVNNESFFSIAREGNRGVLKEVQVLYSISKNNENLDLKAMIREYRIKNEFDLISFPVSKNNPIKKQFSSNFIFKVPNHTNMFYKTLDDTTEHIDVSKISISAINYHTY